jgi:Ti-type conjugative transfer relaxase TraA
MLSIGKISSGPQAAAYYTDQVARGRDDYWAGEGEAPGQWTGTGAGSIGLTGEVDAERFSDLLDGAGLRKPPAEGAVAGFDLTFRAPKSVSVLWAVGSEELVAELRAGHDQAVSDALGYLEQVACQARRGAGGIHQVKGRGFVAAAFVHRASRAGDPLLHTHVVVGNLTQGPDERWTALDARHLYRQAKTAGFLYQAVLRRELTERLGLQWTPVEHGVADITGVSRAVIEHFSQRRAQILEHMAEHGGRSPASAQIAALETRHAKQDVPVDRLRELWRARAAEHGLTPAMVERLVAPQLRIPTPAIAVEPVGLTESASTFGRPELLQALAQAQTEGATVAELERLADELLADREVVRLGDGLAPAGLTESRYSTVELLATERALIETAKKGKDAYVGTAGGSHVEDAIRDRGLSPEQEAVVVELCRSGDAVTVLRAPAGTGKTFVLDAAREAWEADEVDVVGCALSARAALELQDQAGIESVTIAKVTRHLDTGGRLPDHSVLVVDEAGMVGTRALAQLADATQRVDGKLVLVGDDRQLPEIQAGGAFRKLADELDGVELHEVRRQREAWDREALDALRDGEIERWARAYRDKGRITIAKNANDARAALVNDWSRADGDRLMIAARRDDVRDLNQRAREVLHDRDELGPDQVEVDGRRFAVGDRVVGTRNDRQLGILNGQRGTIQAIDSEARSIDVALDTGKEVQIAGRYLDEGRLDHGYAMTAHRAQGATVDRTFVLGSEETYREWGYTALSRHREEARFYISGGELGLKDDRAIDRDCAPGPDPVGDGLRRVLGRSRAQQLATDSLAEIDRDDLEARREQLRERLADAGPPPELD